MAIDTNLVRSEVLAVLDSLDEGFKRFDAEIILRSTDDGPDYLVAADGGYSRDPAKGAADLREFLAHLKNDDPKMLKFDYVERRVTVLAPHVAIVNAPFRQSLRARNGQVTDVRATWALLLTKRSGSWKILQEYMTVCSAADTVVCARP